MRDAGGLRWASSAGSWSASHAGHVQERASAESETVLPTTPEFIIDLRLAPQDRWTDFGTENRKVIRKLLMRARKEASEVAFFGLITAGFGLLSRFYSDHPYIRELEGFADAVGVPIEDLYVANLAYDVASQVSAFHAIGCTSMVNGGDDSTSPMIARNMDWVFPTGVGEHSCLFRFVDEHGSYLSVGFPGVTGVVSAISSHGFALTVNQAPHTSLPSFRSLPMLWLTRLAMDEGTSFASAKRILTTTPAATSSYLMLAGTKPGDAARILSRGSSDEVMKVGRGRYAVVSNHEPGEEEGYEIDDQVGDSYFRYLALEERGALVAAGDIDGAKKALSKWPVFHGDTVHQMVLVPGTGELHLKCPHRGEHEYSVYRV